MELGVYTFGDMHPDPATGETPTPRQKLRQTVELAKLADEVGLDVFAVGEHHRLDMTISAPPVVLAAVAEATQRIRLSPATALVNTLDPVRVFEDYATLDLLSGGRAELLVGRGSFVESFGLFGHRMEDYDALMEEKLGLLLELNRSPRVTWQGRFRPALREAEIAPRPERPLPVWLGIGGSPNSVLRAARLGLPLNIAILGGPERFVPHVRLYRQAAAEAGHDPAQLPVAISSHGHLAEDGQRAKDDYYRAYSDVMRRGLPNRFPPTEVPRAHFDHEAGPRGAIFAGDPQEAIEKIRWERKLFGHQRFLMQPDFGGVPFAKVKRSVELLGTEVAPVVRQEFPSSPRPAPQR